MISAGLVAVERHGGGEKFDIADCRNTPTCMAPRHSTGADSDWNRHLGVPAQRLPG
ncbi:hypothetical protein XCV3265 [Xanthomonas euvesicatoria pv. vesicatoria str. 85-10]|uniref:Uncharacterized protein n=1 Tax=Xanthomonas euvesicatoria pv. vesicatoria (strain 85-10) TaxID=316273 RepID=Q3BQG7_XANE5|nr:hypothetical protein XCV3265 [Xanthomonas euvesicatoria pv. vesicatoria str. 85-10]